MTEYCIRLVPREQAGPDDGPVLMVHPGTTPVETMQHILRDWQAGLRLRRPDGQRQHKYVGVIVAGGGGCRRATCTAQTYLALASSAWVEEAGLADYRISPAGREVI